MKSNIFLLLLFTLTWIGCKKDNPIGNLKTGSFVDARDGKTYSTIEIGNQTWMSENLRYDVPNVYSQQDTVNLGSPTNYGRLYDWATVMNGESPSLSNPSGVQGICPSGWHLPSDSEWNELELHLGMAAADTASYVFRGTHGEAMKSSSGWVLGNGTNTSGFNAFPAGFSRDTTFSSMGQETYFLSSSSLTGVTPICRVFRYDNSGVYRRDASNPSIGFSCRCVKD